MRVEAPARSQTAAQPAPQAAPRALGQPRRPTSSSWRLPAKSATCSSSWRWNHRCGRSPSPRAGSRSRSSMAPIPASSRRSPPGSKPGPASAGWSPSRPTPTPCPTLRESKAEQRRGDPGRRRTQDPLVQAILETFPGANVRVKVKEEQVPLEAYADIIRRRRGRRMKDIMGMMKKPQEHAGQDGGLAGRTSPTSRSRAAPAAAWSPSRSAARATSSVSRSIPRCSRKTTSRSSKT